MWWLDATCKIPSTLNAFLFLPSFLPPCLSFLLPCIGLSHLVGTNLLRGYMHGYFMDIRLYHKVSFPFVGRLVYILFSNMELHPLPPVYNFPLLHMYIIYYYCIPPFLPPSTSVTESILYHTHTHTHTHSHNDSISQAKAVSQPFAYREYRKEKIRQKIDEQRASRVKEKVTTTKLPKSSVLTTVHDNCAESAEG